jgi:N-acetylglutamate synthase/N-acetylornithine aminotransferase
MGRQDVESITTQLTEEILSDYPEIELVDVEGARAALQEKEVIIEVKLGEGSAQAVAWGCDLSYDYVRINASYRS